MSDWIKCQIDGLTEVKFKLKDMGEGARERVFKEINRLTIALLKKVKFEKLSGQVLKVRSGDLRASITQKVFSDSDGIVGIVGTNTPYAKIHEYGGKKAYEITPTHRNALFWEGAEHPVKKIIHPPAKERPFMRPALHEMREKILLGLSNAARGEK